MDLMVVTLSLLLLANEVFSDDKVCGPHSRSYHRYEFEGNCYMTHKSLFYEISWEQAEKQCQEYGGHLMSIHSAAEFQFIKEKIASQRLFDFDSYWIGLKSDFNSPYKWSDGSIVDYMAIIDDAMVLSFEKCVYISEGKWKERDCGKRFDWSYICKFQNKNNTEKESSNATETMPGQCPSGWIKHKHWCRKVFGQSESERLSFNSARSHCQLYHPDGNLVSIQSIEDQMEITSMLLEINADPWIGLRYNSITNTWSWTDFSRMKDFQYWAASQPILFTEHVQSVSLLTSVVASVLVKNPGKWVTKYSNATAPFICEVLPDRTKETSINDKYTYCDLTVKGYLKYGNSCYKIYNERHNWENSKKTCVGDGGSLASIQNGFQQAFLQTILREATIASNKSNQIWIGLRREPPLFQFQWINGDDFEFDNWDSNFSLSVYRNETRVGMLVASGHWTETNSSELNPFICEIKQEKDRGDDKWRTTTTVNPNDLECPYGDSVDYFHISNDKCYFLETSSTRSWQESQLACSKSGGILATRILSSNDAVAIGNYLRKNTSTLTTWIGFYKDEREVRWVDLKPFNSILKSRAFRNCSELTDIFKYYECTVKQKSEFKYPKCGAFEQSDGHYLLDFCETKSAYMCEIGKVRKLESLSTTKSKSTPSSSTVRIPSSSTERIPSSSTARIPSSSTERIPSSSTERIPSSSTERIPSSSPERTASSSTERIPSSSTERTPSFSTESSATLLTKGQMGSASTSARYDSQKHESATEGPGSKSSSASHDKSAMIGIVTSIVVIAIIGLIIVGVLVYFRMRKKERAVDEEPCLNFTNQIYLKSDEDL